MMKRKVSENCEIKKNGSKSRLLDKIQYILLITYVSLIYIFNDNAQLSFLYYIVLSLFIIIEFGYILKNKRIMFTKHILIVFFFVFVCFLSFLWASDSGAVMSRSMTVLLLAFSLLFMYNYCIRTSKTVEDILRIILFAGVVFTIFIACFYGINGILEVFSNDHLRIGEGIDNSNAIGMELAATVVVAVYFGISKNKLYYLLAIFPAILSFGTASKNAFFYIIIGVILVVVLGSKGKMSFTSVAKKIVLPLIVFILTFVMIQSNMFPMLSNRLNDFSNNTGTSTRQRGDYIKYGFEYFLNHPFTGVGVNNSSVLTMDITGESTYLHNNYVELLATVGIFGFLVYYYVFVSLLFFAVKNRKVRGASVVIVVLLLCLMSDWGTVAYYHKTVYIYILLGTLFYSSIVKSSKNEGMIRNEEDQV